MTKKIEEEFEAKVGDIVQPMSDQERLQQCNQEIVQVLDKYHCELQAVPQSRAEGAILIIDATPRLLVKLR